MAWLLIYRDDKRVDRKHVPNDLAHAGGPFAVSGLRAIRVKMGQSIEREGVVVRLVADGEHVAPMTSIPLHSGELARTATRTGATRVRDTADGNSTVSLVTETPRMPKIQGYNVMGLVGAGGMGLVWLAQQQEPERIVAVKVMRENFTRADLRERFLSEIQLAAKLEHANIARVYNVGTTGGMPYFSMQYIDGVALDDYVTRIGRDQGTLISLMIKICDAVEHAHERGIIHCDLKFTNVLVSDRGEPFVLDFGLARALSDDDENTARLQDGRVEGTPAFMSPEQAAGRVRQLSTRTDVYSLGVIFYWLLLRQPPHLVQGSARDVIRRIRTEDIPRARTVNRTVNGELESILVKALARDPEDRYGSAGDLATDLRNYEAGEPLLARPATTLYFLSRRIRKHKGKVSVAAVVLLAGLILLATSYVAIAQQRTRAVEAKNEAELSEQQAQIEAERARSLMYANRISLVKAELDHQNVARAKALLASFPVDRRAWEWRYLHRRADASIATTSLQNRQFAIAAAASHGQVLYTGYIDGDVYRYDLSTHEHTHVATMPERIISMDAYLDGTRLAVFCDDRTVYTIDPGTGDTVASYRGTFDTLRATADGKRLVGAPCVVELNEDEPRVWEGQVTQPREHLMCSAPVPGGDAVVFGSDAGLVYLDTEANDPVQIGSHGGQVWSIAVAPDASVIASGGTDGSVKIWDLERRELVRVLIGHQPSVTQLAFSPDGDLLVSGDISGRLMVWDVASGTEIETLSGHVGRVVDVGFDADGTKLRTVSLDNTAKHWDMTARASQLVLDWPKSRVSSSVRSKKPIVFLSRDGSVMAFDEPNLKLHRTTDGTAIAKNGLDPAVGQSTVAFGPGNDSLVHAGIDGDGTDLAVHYRYDAATARYESEWQHSLEGAPASVTQNATGSLVAIGLKVGLAYVLNANTGERLNRYDVARRPVKHVAFSPDSTHLYTADASTQHDDALPSVNVFAVGPRGGVKAKHKFGDLGEHIDSLATTASGALVVSRRRAGTLLQVIRLDVPEGGTDPQATILLELPVSSQTAAGLTPDGSRLVLAGENNLVNVIRVEDGLVALSLSVPGKPNHPWQVPRVAALAITDHAIATVSGSTVTVLRAPPASASHALVFNGPLEEILIHPDRHDILVRTAHGNVSAWSPDAAQWSPSMAEITRGCTALAFGNNGLRHYAADAEGAIWRHAPNAVPRSHRIARLNTTVQALESSGDNELVAITDDHRAVVLDASDGKVIREFALPDDGHRARPQISPNGMFIVAVAGPGALRRTNTGHTENGRADYVTPTLFELTAVEVTSSGAVAAADSEGDIWIWSTPDALPTRLRAGKQPISAITTSDDGTRLLAARPTDLLLYELAHADGQTGPSEAFNVSASCAAFDPEMTRIFVGDTAGGLREYSLDAPKRRGILSRMR